MNGSPAFTFAQSAEIVAHVGVEGLAIAANTRSVPNPIENIDTFCGGAVYEFDEESVYLEPTDLAEPVNPRAVAHQASPAFTADDTEKLTLIEKLKDVKSVATKQARVASNSGKLLLFGMMGMTAYEYGPGNEVGTPLVTGPFIDMHDGLGGIMLTAGVAGGSVLVQQLFSGYLAVKTVEAFPEVAERIYSHITDNDNVGDISPFNDLSQGEKLSRSFFLGATYNVLREAFLNPGSKNNKLVSVVAKSAIRATLATSTIAGSADLINQQFPDNTAVQLLVDVIANPALWVGASIAVVANDIRKTKEHLLSVKNEATAQ